MTRRIYILLFVILGFFLTPKFTYACDKPEENTEMSFHKNVKPKSDKDNCCNHHEQKDKKVNDCDEKCKGSSCHCPITSFTILIPFGTEVKYSNIFLEKTTIAYTETYISSGFCTIWLPPKIA